MKYWNFIYCIWNRISVNFYIYNRFFLVLSWTVLHCTQQQRTAMKSFGFHNRFFYFSMRKIIENIQKPHSILPTIDLYFLQPKNNNKKTKINCAHWRCGFLPQNFLLCSSISNSIRPADFESRCRHFVGIYGVAKLYIGMCKREFAQRDRRSCISPLPNRVRVQFPS